jgi:hypothetical protein
MWYSNVGILRVFGHGSCLAHPQCRMWIRDRLRTLDTLLVHAGQESHLGYATGGESRCGASNRAFGAHETGQQQPCTTSVLRLLIVGVT